MESALKTIKLEMKKYVELKRNDPADEFDELNLWFSEGANKNGEDNLSLAIYKKLLDSCQTMLKYPLDVYKFFEAEEGITNLNEFIELFKNEPLRYSSYTAADIPFYVKTEGRPDDNKLHLVMPKGSKVILADGFADSEEVIIRADFAVDATKAMLKLRK